RRSKGIRCGDSFVDPKGSARALLVLRFTGKATAELWIGSSCESGGGAVGGHAFLREFHGFIDGEEEGVEFGAGDHWLDFTSVLSPSSSRSRVLPSMSVKRK